MIDMFITVELYEVLANCPEELCFCGKCQSLVKDRASRFRQQSETIVTKEKEIDEKAHKLL